MGKEKGIEVVSWTNNLHDNRNSVLKTHLYNDSEINLSKTYFAIIEILVGIIGKVMKACNKIKMGCIGKAL